MMTPRDIADEIVGQWSYDVHCGAVAGPEAYELLRNRLAQVLEAYGDIQRKSIPAPAPPVLATAPATEAPSAPDNYYHPDPSYYWGNRKPLFL